MKFLNISELEALSTKRLLVYLRLINIKLSSINTYYGPRCCEVCNEYVGTNWEEDVGRYLRPFEEYKDLVKSVLSNREHIDRKTRKPITKRVKINSSGRGRGKYKYKQPKINKDKKVATTKDWLYRRVFW